MKCVQKQLRGQLQRQQLQQKKLWQQQSGQRQPPSIIFHCHQLPEHLQNISVKDYSDRGSIIEPDPKPYQKLENDNWFLARFTQELFTCPKLCSCQANVYHVNCIQMDLTEPPENLPISANLLDLRLNNIEILNELAFSGLSELASLHLDLNSIMTIRQGAFRGLKNLIYLYLSNNQIRKVYPNST